MSKDWTQEKAFEVLEGEITRLTAENEALANDRDGYVQLLTDQNNALTARVAELEGQHKGLVIQNALLRQRPDLPADRIPAARGVEALTARVKELEAMLRTASDMNEVYEGRFQEMEAALGLYREAVRIDATMDGPKFMGSNASALKRAWDADRAALTQPAPGKEEA